MKKIVFNICLILGTLGGLLLLLYPHISFLFADYNQSYVTRQYDEQLEHMGEETRQQVLADAQAYNEQLLGDAITDPFLEGSGKVLPEDYLTQLNLGEVMGHVKIPTIQVDLPIYHGTAGDTLQKGAGHLEGTSLPVGGAGTHTVITGHTGLSSAKMFTDLSQLQQGDEFYLHVLGEVLAYRVDQIKVVEPHMVDDLKPVSGQEYATLITCTPYGINSHRLIVRGTRVPYTAQQLAAQVEAAQPVLSKETILLAASLAALVILLVLALAVMRKTRRTLRRRRRVAHARRYYAAPKAVWCSTAGIRPHPPRQTALHKR